MDFAVGFITGIWFWPILAIVILCFLAEDSWGWGTLSLAVGLGIWYFASKPLQINWGAVISYAGMYIVIGLAFTFIKWWFYARKSGRLFLEAWDVNEANPENQRELRTDFARRKSNDDRHGIIKVSWDDTSKRWQTNYEKPRLVGRVTLWTAYWPLYAALIVLEDLIKQIIDWFVGYFGGLYRRISDSAYNAG